MNYFQLAKDLTQNHLSGLTIQAQLSDCVALARKLRDEPYAYDRDGKMEFELDIRDLCSKLLLLEAEYLGGDEI